MFTGHLRWILIHRDQVCRTPWCGALIRHLDHATAASRDGATSLDNGQGLCERCNYAKEDPGWTTTPQARPNELAPDRSEPTELHPAVHIVETPTGHRYRSVPPPSHPGDPAGTSPGQKPTPPVARLGDTNSDGASLPIGAGPGYPVGTGPCRPRPSRVVSRRWPSQKPTPPNCPPSEGMLVDLPSRVLLEPGQGWPSLWIVLI